VKTLKRISIGFGLLLAALVGLGFFLPHQVHIQRSAIINVPPCEVYAVLDGFRSFDRWSPWADKDPQMKVEMTGPAAGVGAHYSWLGNKDVGGGSQEIVANTPDRRVELALQFSGFDGVSRTIYALEPTTEGTQLTWSIDTPLGHDPISPYFGLMMDSMVGSDFEKGLARLKTLLEKQPKLDCPALGAQLLNLTPVSYVLAHGTSTTDFDSVDKALTAAYKAAGDYMHANGLGEHGHPIAITRRWDDQANIYAFDAGFPVEVGDGLPAPSATAQVVPIGGGLTLRFEHKGPYSGLHAFYDGINAYQALAGLHARGDSWEEYVSDAGKTPASDLITRIYVPIN